MKIKPIIFIAFLLAIASIDSISLKNQQNNLLQSSEMLQPKSAVGDPTINPITPNPSTFGSISLSWTTSSGATCYYLYRDINPISSSWGRTFDGGHCSWCQDEKTEENTKCGQTIGDF